MSPSATPATQSGAARRATNGDQAHHQSQPSATSATPATQMERQCHNATLATQMNVNVTKCHVCHAKWRPGRLTATKHATKASQSGAAPWATNGDQARHQSQPNATSATPATEMERQCHQVQRLPRKVARRPGRLTATKRTTRASQVQQVPRLPRQWNVNVTKCHTCHANGTSIKCHASHAKWRGAPGH